MARCFATLALLAGCWTGGALVAAKPPQEQSPMTRRDTDRALRLELTTSATTLTMAERAAFQIGVRATNQGDAVLEPRLDLAELTVNGESSMDWRMAIGNGGREKDWRAMPAGKTVEMQWPLGEALFRAPGTYKIELSLSDVEGNLVANAEPTTITVTP